MIEAQIATMVGPWGWKPTDHIVNVLPLHHVHGVVNVVCCALWTGAKLTMLPKFTPAGVWSLFKSQPDLSLFMAVPTVYGKLIAEFEQMSAEDQKACLIACRKFRLMVSGSAALPTTTMAAWENISGHTLLERYGTHSSCLLFFPLFFFQSSNN
jgi:malonyl-CoA/methylmalonyl-CoA synthetase